MFSMLVRALQEGHLGDAEDPEKESDGEEEQAHEAKGDEAQGSAQDASGFSLLNLANTLASTVQQKASEIVATVKETDWKTEIEHFKNELQEDTQQLAHTLEDAVEHLPENARSKEFQVSVTQWQEHLNQLGKSLYVGTTELIGQVSEAIQDELHQQNQATGRKPRTVSSATNRYQPINAKYSRFEAEVSAMQRDSSTYCDEPEDQNEFELWLKTFDLQQRKADIDEIIKDNAFMSELQARIVPLIVEYDVFWTRYFYRLHKLQQKHEQRVQLAQRAANMQDEEVSWDDDVSEQGTASPHASQVPAAPHRAERHEGNVGEQLTVAPKDGALNASVPETPERQVAEDSKKSDFAEVKTVQDSVPLALSPKGDDDTASSDSATVKVNPHLSDEEGIETATASESGSSGDPWCVVTSPSKKQAESGPKPFDDHEVTSPVVASKSKHEGKTSKTDTEGKKKPTGTKGSKAAELVSAAGAAVTTIKEEPSVEESLSKSDSTAKVDPNHSKPAANNSIEDEDIDLDELSGDEAPLGNGEEVDEDWGSWE